MRSCPKGSDIDYEYSKSHLIHHTQFLCPVS